MTLEHPLVNFLDTGVSWYETVKAFHNIILCVALYVFGVSHGGRNDVISLVVLSKELVLLHTK